MISIHLERKELWDDENNQFVYWGPEEPIDIQMEHSLVSIYKWESKYHKSYLDTKEKTVEEAFDYMAMMVVGDLEDKISPDIFKSITDTEVSRLHDYMDNPMTATTFSQNDESKDAIKKKTGEKFMSAELIYYYMSALSIPFECERWHINKLLTLIRVCSIKNEEASKGTDKKKNRLTSTEMAARRARMEAARAKYRK